MGNIDETEKQKKLNDLREKNLHEKQKSDLPIVGRYGNIVNDSKREVSSVNSLVNSIFADGVVTNREMNTLIENHEDVVYDFIVAVDVYRNMKKSGEYSQSILDNAYYVMSQLKIARDISHRAIHQATYSPEKHPDEVEKRKEKKEAIHLVLQPAEIALVSGVVEDMFILAYQEDKEKMPTLTEKQRHEREKRIYSMIRKVEHNRTPSLILSLYNQRQNS